ncbi:MAG: cyclic-di-AMP receptor [Anaerolineales bacterium]|nr:cyclic-di-AMP receptor [Anaerolineales bacterium]
MKMMIVILNDVDPDPVIASLIENQFRVTRIASTGGFLRRGNSTLIMGVEDERVEEAIALLRSACPVPEIVDQRRATVFVIAMEDYVQL